MGESGEELFKLSGTIEIDTQDAVNRIDNIIKSVENTGEKIVKSIDSMSNNITKSINNIFNKIQITDKTKESQKEILEATNNISESFEDMEKRINFSGSQFEKKIENSSKIIKKITSDSQDWFKYDSNEIQEYVDSYAGKLEDAFKKLNSRKKELKETLALPKLKEEIRELEEELRGAKERELKELQELVGKAAGNNQKEVLKYDEFAKSIVNKFDSISIRTMALFAQTSNKMKSLLNGTMSYISNLAIVDFVKDIDSAVSEIFVGIKESWNNLKSFIVETDLGKIMGKSFNGFKEIAISSINAVKNVFNAAKNIVTSTFNMAQNSVKSIMDSVKKTVSYMHSMDTMSRRIGLSVSKYQEYGFVFEKVGLSVDSLQGGMMNLNRVLEEATKVQHENNVEMEKAEDIELRKRDRNLALEKAQIRLNNARKMYKDGSIKIREAELNVAKAQNEVAKANNKVYSGAGGTKQVNEYADAFKRLGVSVKGNDGNLRKQQDILSDTIKALRNIKNESERARLAVKLFGGVGTQMLPMLDKDRFNIDEAMQQARDFGLVIEESIVKTSTETHNKFVLISNIVKNMKLRLGTIFSPALNSILDNIFKHIPSLNRSIERVTPALTEIFNKLTPKINEFIDKYMPKILDFIDTKIVSKLEEISDMDFSDMWNIFLESGQSAIERIKELLIDMIGEVFKKATLELIKSPFKAAWNNITDNPMDRFVKENSDEMLQKTLKKYNPNSSNKKSKKKVEKYASGAVFTKPTVFGVNPHTKKDMVGGEAGKEAIAPISTLQEYISQSVKTSINGESEIVNLLKMILESLKSFDSILYETIVNALINGVNLEWENRNLARLVKKYA